MADIINSCSEIELDTLEIQSEKSSSQDASCTNDDPVETLTSINKTLIFEDDIKKSKDNIKRRRSSYGTSLSKRRSICYIDSVDNENVTKNFAKVDGNGTSDIEKISASDLHYCKPESNVMGKEAERLEIQMFEEKTKKFEIEYTAWKKLVKTRRAKLLEAIRNYKDAKKGITLIEEEDISPELRNYSKSISLSQPDYNEYLRSVNYVKDRAVFAKLEVLKVSSSFKAHLNLAKLYSKFCFQILDKKAFGERVDPKVVLKALQNEY